MPHVDSYVTPAGRGLLSRLFNNSSINASEEAYKAWMTNQVGEGFFDYVGVEPSLLQDTLVYPTRQSSILPADLTLIVTAKWTAERHDVRLLIEQRLVDRLLAKGFALRIEVHVVLIGTPTNA